ncbi:hypothetical protein SSCG_02190 [Streptomyces clavuligerus]|nr:hypothetical protein SSCG_02190 [Streptomyces clavuligerus]
MGSRRWAFTSNNRADLASSGCAGCSGCPVRPGLPATRKALITRELERAEAVCRHTREGPYADTVLTKVREGTP